MFAQACRSLVTVAGLILCTVAPLHAGADAQKTPREPTESVNMVYRLTQGEREVGAETVTRTTFSDNTVEFDAVSDMTFADNMRMVTTVLLTLEEESYFPRSLRLSKLMDSGTTSFEHKTNIDMVSNVAIVTTELNKKHESYKRVLPLGTPFIEIGIVHYVYQLLFWYDDRTGGRQNFQLYDLPSGKLEGAVINRVEKQTIEVMGESVEAWLYELEREKMKFSFHADADGRILRLEQPTMIFELTEWAQATPEDDSPGD